MLQADRSDKAHAIRLRTREVTHEAAQIRGSRYPKLDGVIEGTIFDMTDYEDEYEVVGKVEITMPLYDGGTARARLRETAWRENELKSSLEAMTRDHNREMEGLAHQFHQQTREETEALARQDALRGKVRHADVRAPLRGIVSAVHVKTVGAVVQAGTMLAEIVPAEAEYLVRAQVLPQNVKDVQPGQIARISLAAYDPSRYGVIMGVVRQVASNTTQPETAMPFYETIIAIPEVSFTKSPDIPIVTAGMPLQVDILGGKRTIMTYIMTPIQKSLATAFREK